MLLFVAGCSSLIHSPSVTEITDWRKAPQVKPVNLGRVRVSPDQPLPESIIRKLSDQFTLVCVNRNDRWKKLAQRFHLSNSAIRINLNKGIIVGILAEVGKPATHQWPIRINRIHNYSGYGLLSAHFVPGIYHPLKTAGYLDLVYLPGVRQIHTIRINRQTFILSPPALTTPRNEPVEQPINHPEKPAESPPEDPLFLRSC
jgi:hypothetical protein